MSPIKTPKSIIKKPVSTTLTSVIFINRTKFIHKYTIVTENWETGRAKSNFRRANLEEILSQKCNLQTFQSGLEQGFPVCTIGSRIILHNVQFYHGLVKRTASELNFIVDDAYLYFYRSLYMHS